jgi:GntR family transcriptional regulator, transcriptional repressor for pyruvate dehydrogenase complex
MIRPNVTVDEFDEADVQFHIALVASSNNEAMHQIMLAVRHAIAEHLLEALRRLPRSRPTLRALADQHAQILAAIESGDAARAASLVQDHITHFYERFLTPSGNNNK